MALRGEVGFCPGEETAPTDNGKAVRESENLPDRVAEVMRMRGGSEERVSGEPGPVTFTCYRITPGEEEGAPGEDMAAYSLVVLLPDGEFRHQVVWAGAPEDVGDAIRVPPGSRVIMTEMANARIWDSGPAETEEATVEAAPAS